MISFAVFGIFYLPLTVPIPCFIFGGVKSVSSMDILVFNHFRARGFSAFWSISWLMSLACKLAIKRFMWAELSHMRLRECLISFYLATKMYDVYSFFCSSLICCKLFRIAVSLWNRNGEWGSCGILTLQHWPSQLDV